MVVFFYYFFFQRYTWKFSGQVCGTVVYVGQNFFGSFYPKEECRCNLFRTSWLFLKHKFSIKKFHWPQTSGHLIVYPNCNESAPAEILQYRDFQIAIFAPVEIPFGHYQVYRGFRKWLEFVIEEALSRSKISDKRPPMCRG